MRFALTVLALAITTSNAYATAPAAADSERIAADPPGLAATTAPPWNPPHALARRRGWERVVLMPERIVTLPFWALGRGVEAGLLYVEDTDRVPIAAVTGGPSAPPARFGVSTPGLGGRAGIGAGVTARQTLLGGPLQTRWTARYGGTVRNYNGTLITAAGRPLTVQYGYDWRPEEHFYGIGGGTSRFGLSDYAAQSEFVRVSMGRGPASVTDAMRGFVTGPVQRRAPAGVWIETRNQLDSRGREPGVPTYERLYPAFAEATGDHRVENLVYGIQYANDWRAGSPHWTHGARVLLSAERHDAPIPAIALRSGSPGGAQFNRYRIEGETGFSFMRNPRSIRLLGRVLDQSAGGNAERMMPADMATLGSSYGLAGYEQGRFHDLDMLLTRATYIFPLGRRLEMDLHAEWGNVYSDVWRNARIDRLHASQGIALRGVDQKKPFGSIGLDWSGEGLRLSYALGGIQ